MATIIRTARAIMACLNAMTGTRSTGTVLVTATGADVDLPRNSYALPVIDGRQRPDLAVKVAEGSNDDGSWTVTSGGTAVSFLSNIGGERMNLPLSTPLTFDPPVSGIESAVVSVAFSGGANASDYGSLEDLAMAEHIGPLPLDLARSSIKGFPCALITWVDDEPYDSATTSMASPRTSRMGTRKNLYKATYQISVICSKSTSDHVRRALGLEIADSIAETLVDKQAIDGEKFSNPSGLQIVRRWKEGGGGPAYQKYYVYTMLVSAMVTFWRTDTRSYSDWEKTILDVDKQLDNEADLRLVDGVTISMTGS